MPTVNVDEIIIPTKAEAEEVLNALWSIVKKDGQASVADFFGLCDLKSTFTDARRGWTIRELANAKVVQNQGNWRIHIQPPVQIIN